ncbi:hypothetical protein ACWC5F_32080 [Streptomyces sp. NPDC001272]
MFLVTHRAVFSRSCPSPWTENYAVLGGRPAVSSSGAAAPELETDAELAFAFRTAADLLAERWYANRMDDSLVLVVLYNYRHALELGLKVVLRALVDSIKFEVAPEAGDHQLEQPGASPLGHTRTTREPRTGRSEAQAKPHRTFLTSLERDR